MMAGTPTWTDKEEYPRPVLPNHDEDAAPLGRVLDAKYVDLSYLYKTEYPIIQDSIFYCSDSKKRMSEWESVDWIVENLCPLKDYKGLGYIELGLKVTEPDAIKRVLRKEYLTVSVGFSTDSAKCSICHQDWAVDDRCDHQLGRKYDSKRCFVLSNSMEFHECSFVNAPADPFATTISVEKLTDSVNREFFLGLSLTEQEQRAKEVGIVLTDAFYSADIEMVEDTKEMTDLKKISAEIKSAELSAERALAIRQELSDSTGDSDAEKKQIKKLLSTVKAKIKANGWDAAPTEKSEDSKAADQEIADAAAAAAAPKAKPATENTDSVPAGDAPAAEGAEPPTNEVAMSDALKNALASTEMKDANEEVLTVVKSLDSSWNALDEAGKRYLRYAVGALASSWYAKEDLDMYLGWLTKDSDSVVIAKSEHDALTDAVEKFETTEKELKDAVSSEEAAKLSVLKQAKDALATLIVMHKVHSGVQGYVGLNTDQINEAITKRTKYDLKTLCALRDEVLEELQFAKPKVKATDATSTNKADEPAGKEVPDSAQVDEPTPGDASNGTQLTDSKPEPEPEVVVPSRYMSGDPEAARIFLATQRFKKLQQQ
jgi:hypothetical protein